MIDVGAFAASLPSRGRLIGLDVGTVRIGTALCDAQWTIASPAHIIKRLKFSVDLEALRTLIQHEIVTGLVIGLPLNMDGSDSARTQSIRAFARNLAPLNRPILLWDERWSTVAVERQMIAADMTRAKRAQHVDNAAAAFILQGAIDRLATISI